METTQINTDRRTTEKYKSIPGWGHDADPSNDPSHPMKRTTGDDHQRLNYRRPTQQPVNVELLKSNERPSITRVFGTSTPPSGLSGALRRYAFKFSEGSSGHWLTLILADRINVVEGLVHDLRRGHIPNLFAERGWTAEWKYNRKPFVTKLVVGAAIAGAVIALAAAASKRKKKLPEPYLF